MSAEMERMTAARCVRRKISGGMVEGAGAERQKQSDRRLRRGCEFEAPAPTVPGMLKTGESKEAEIRGRAGSPRERDERAESCRRRAR